MKGILFKDWKIKAIAEDDREWMTRRVIKPQPITETLPSPNGTVIRSLGYFWKHHFIGQPEDLTHYARYQVGEVVYIKEAWKAGIRGDEAYLTLYKDGSSKLGLCDPAAHRFAHYASKWQSPLFMPEWAARLFIKITDIRAERLNQISPNDITQEGFDSLVTFMLEWDKINKKRGYGWQTNCWVWIYEFRKV
ncbi:MAG TPA: hypothetical protein VMW45_04360 [Dehalococcoidia bacterium]|nr:hypothetical protein [Dehalococcoidia bacterium]